jgi:Fibronectin type III domain
VKAEVETRIAGPFVRRRRGLWSRWPLGALSLLLLGLAFGAGSAAAENIHPTALGSYGKEAVASTGTGNGCRITFHRAEKRLYLFSDQKIYGLKITAPGTAEQIAGYPVVTGISSNFCTQSDMAIDNTAGASAGRNYLIAGGQGASEINAFAPNGTKLGAPNFPAISTSMCAVETTPTGEFWVYNQFPQPPTLTKFSSTGEPLGQIAFGQGNCPQFTMDPVTLDLYVSTQGTLRKFTAASAYKTSQAIAPASETRDYVVNGALKKAYIATASGFEAFDTETAERLETVSAGGAVGSLALDESTDTLFAQVGSGASGRLKEYPAAVVPNVTTGNASSEGVVEGSADPVGAGPITSCVVEYGLSSKERGQAYEQSVPCQPATPYPGPGVTNITANLTGLVGESLYHYRVIAGNANGKGYGKDKTFVPHYVQDVLTEAPSAVTTASATLNASFTGNSEVTHYFFEWGLKGKPYEHTTPDTNAGPAVGHTPAPAPISGLTSDTEYHYRVVMYNPKGNSPGNEVVFSSQNAVKSLTTEPVTSLTSSSATLNGSWDGNGELTHFFFEWGFANTADYEHVTPASPANGGSALGFQVHGLPISELASNANYKYRIVASNGLGVSVGANQTFKTFKFPSVVYQQASKYETDSVTFNALVNPNNGGATTYHFDYGLDTNYGSSTPESSSVGSDDTFHPASAPVTGLLAGTTYHYRIVATGPGGSFEGGDQTFTTIPSPPAIVSSSVSERTQSEATINAQVKPGFGATVVYFEYGQTSDYGSTTVPGPPLSADDTAHPVSVRLEGLAPETTYHYQVVALNFGGSSHSSDQTFTTAGRPIVTGQVASALTETSASVSALVNPSLSATAYHVEYGTTRAYGSSTPQSGSVGSDNSNHSVGANLTGLTPGTTYHFRVVAENSVGSTGGEDATFTTSKQEVKPPPRRCKKGFVKRHGKCIKKKKKRHHRKHGNRAGK